MSISAPETVTPLLSVNRLSAYYGEVRALEDVTFEVGAGEMLSIIGANGAGKSTLLKSIAGLMSRGQAAHIRGEVEFRGRRLDRMRPEEIVHMGIALVPEGRRLFPRLTVEDNLLAGAYLPRCRRAAAEGLAEVYQLFPPLAERRQQVVAQMSGGEQQMVAIGRALMSSPTLLLFDELSLGLAPAVVDTLYGKVMAIHDRGVTCVIIEQDMNRALGVATHVFVLLEGRLVLDGRPGELSREAITAAYFGSDLARRR